MKRTITGHFAHRGLWDERIPENSLTAFGAAVDAGFGIELDIQLSSDGRVMVFHDYDLERMTGERGKLGEKTFEELRELRLRGTDERIPTLEEVLALVAGRTAILIELKGECRDVSVCRAADVILRDYAGPYLVESFNPKLLSWYKKNRPDVTRGILSTRVCKEQKKVTPLNILLDMLWLNPMARPHFIAYDIRYGQRLPVFIAVRVFRKIPVVWTVRNMEDYKALDARGIHAIFERIRP